MRASGAEALDTSSRWASERASRSIRTTTSVSPGPIRSRQRASSTRPRLAPEARSSKTSGTPQPAIRRAAGRSAAPRSRPGRSRSAPWDRFGPSGGALSIVGSYRQTAVCKPVQSRAGAFEPPAPRAALEGSERSTTKLRSAGQGAKSGLNASSGRKCRRCGSNAAVCFVL